MPSTFEKIQTKLNKQNGFLFNNLNHDDLILIINGLENNSTKWAGIQKNIMTNPSYVSTMLKAIKNCKILNVWVNYAITNPIALVEIMNNKKLRQRLSNDDLASIAHHYSVQDPINDKTLIEAALHRFVTATEEQERITADNFLIKNARKYFHQLAEQTQAAFLERRYTSNITALNFGWADLYKLNSTRSQYKAIFSNALDYIHTTVKNSKPNFDALSPCAKLLVTHLLGNANQPYNKHTFRQIFAEKSLIRDILRNQKHSLTLAHVSSQIKGGLVALIKNNWRKIWNPIKLSGEDLITLFNNTETARAAALSEAEYKEIFSYGWFKNNLGSKFRTATHNLINNSLTPLNQALLVPILKNKTLRDKLELHKHPQLISQLEKMANVSIYMALENDIKISPQLNDSEKVEFFIQLRTQITVLSLENRDRSWLSLALNPNIDASNFSKYILSDETIADQIIQDKNFAAKLNEFYNKYPESLNILSDNKSQTIFLEHIPQVEPQNISAAKTSYDVEQVKQLDNIITTILNFGTVQQLQNLMARESFHDDITAALAKKVKQVTLSEFGKDKPAMLLAMLNDDSLRTAIYSPSDLTNLAKLDNKEIAQWIVAQPQKSYLNTFHVVDLSKLLLNSKSDNLKSAMIEDHAEVASYLATVMKTLNKDQLIPAKGLIKTLLSSSQINKNIVLGQQLREVIRDICASNRSWNNDSAFSEFVEKNVTPSKLTSPGRTRGTFYSPQKKRPDSRQQTVAKNTLALNASI